MSEDAMNERHDPRVAARRGNGAIITLLSVIAVAAVVIAVVLITRPGAAKPWKESSQRQAAREQMVESAQIYCTLGGVVPGLTSLQDPAYKACVQDQVKSKLEAWDNDHPHDAPPDGKGFDHIS